MLSEPPMRFRPLALPLLLAVALAGCKLYFSDDDGSGASDAAPRPGDSTPTPECDIRQSTALSGFRTCMDFEAWEEAGLCDLSRLVAGTGNDRRPCFSCHANGMNGTHLEQSCELTFQAMQTWPIPNHLIVPVEDEDGCFTGFTTGRICPDGSTDHDPPFRCPNSFADSLESYIQSTYGAWTGGECGN
jgi:hypothetical protein